MAYLWRTALVTITTFSLLLAVRGVCQSRPNVPGDTLQSVMGLTDPNALNDSWQTPLMAAAFNGDEKLVKVLIARKANVNVASRFGVTALMYARNLPTVKLLLEAGASVKDKDTYGRTPLRYAVEGADPEVVRALIEAGADVNAKDDKDMSVLQVAKSKLQLGIPEQDLPDAYRKQVHKVIELLIASGARNESATTKK